MFKKKKKKNKIKSFKVSTINDKKCVNGLSLMWFNKYIFDDNDNKNNI
mgnify:CR=1 FL=1